MLELKKIAITGGVASGKTSVCRFLKERGAYVVDADAIVHELLTPDTDLGQQVIQLLGPEVLQDGKIDRKSIAAKVFRDKELLAALEQLLHPAVLRRVQELYARACEERRFSLFVVEIPLLFEVQADVFYEVTVTVIADETQAKKRFEAAGFARGDYERRMERQLAPEEKARRADIVLYNTGSFAELQAKTDKLYQQLTTT